MTPVEEARATLQSMANQCGYSHHTRAVLVSQMMDAWLRYRLRPMILPSPQAAPTSATAVAPPPQQIICMAGNLSISVGSRLYPIPLRVYVLMPCPLVSPLVYVAKYAGAVVPRDHPFVDPRTGYVDLTSHNLPPGGWRPGDNSIPQILMRLQRGFGMRSPLVEDPEYVEKREKSAQLTGMLQARLLQETQQGQAEYAAATRQLHELRQMNVQLVAKRDRLAAQEGSGASKELAVTRDELLRVEALLREYGVEAGADIQLEDLLMISSGHPLRDQDDDLRVEILAVEDALVEADEAFGRKQVGLEEWLRKTRELATQKCQIKTRLIKLGREMDAAVEADAKREALEAAREVGGGGSGSGGGGGYADRPAGGFPGTDTASRNAAMSGLMRSRSKLVTSGILPVKHMPMHRGIGRAGGGAPPPPGPPSYAS